MDVIDEVRQAVAKALNIPATEIKSETRLDELGMNSLDVMEVIFEMEQRFGIDIPLEQENRPADQAGKGTNNLPFETIADVADAITQHIGAKPAS
jgi:acyl carrier protein